ncbi:helix-turn-helix domain-containing protein [Streptomyces lunaelactis]|uniref:helix-turn-helix domain-containing protein n=1 Tax=Streptomyces lunaelactis TaxID=1535768 RepID=UPI0035A1C71B
MPRWKVLPDELDPQVREFTSQLRRLVDRSGLNLSAVADRTGYSKTSWERYLNGRLLAPKGAIVALAEVTGTNTGHLTTMWELAERAWSRSEMRHDMTMEAIRISQARAALGEFGPAPAGTANGRSAGRTAAPAEPVAPEAGAFGSGSFGSGGAASDEGARSCSRPDSGPRSGVCWSSAGSGATVSLSLSASVARVGPFRTGGVAGRSSSSFAPGRERLSGSPSGWCGSTILD